MEIEKVIMDIAMQVAKSINEPRVVINQHHLIGASVTVMAGTKDETDVKSGTVIDVFLIDGCTYYLVRMHETPNEIYSINPESVIVLREPN